MTTSPTLGYWHLWTDDSGISHQTNCLLDDFGFAGVGNAAPQWNKSLPGAGSEIVVTVQPAGWVGEWHENPMPQWIVVLSGGWWIESMDGTRIEQWTGDVSLGADQNCRDTGGRRGHRSGTIGDAPAVLMCVRLASALPPQPCVFR